MWSNQGMTCQRSSGDGTRLYQKSHPPASRASAATRQQQPLRPLHGAPPRLRPSAAAARPVRAWSEPPARTRRSGRRCTWIVGDAPLAHEHAQQRHRRDRAQRAEQDGELERDHDIGRDRGDRLAAHQERPVERHPDRHAEPGGAAGEAADQREQPHRAHRLVERLLDLVVGRGGIDDQVPVPPGAERPNRVHRGVHVDEGGEHARRAPDPLREAISDALPPASAASGSSP